MNLKESKIIDKKNYWTQWFPLTVIILIFFRVALYIYFVMSGGQFIHPDSALYLELARQLIETGDFFLPKEQPEVIQPFGVLSKDAGRVLLSVAPEGPEVFRTPGYPAFLVLLHWLGINNPYVIVFFQELIYGLSVGVFYKYGQQLFTKYVVQAGVIFMLISSGSLVWPKYLISETLFFPFLVTSILYIGLYLKSSRIQFLIIAGILMGIGAWIRPAIQYLPVVVTITIILFNINDKKKWLHSGAMLVVFLLLISPWLARNYYHYGKVFMSGQGSNLLAKYHVPAVWHWQHISEYELGQNLAQQKVKTLVKQKEQQLGRSINAVEYFTLQQNWALKELGKYPVTYFEQWLIGAFRVMYEAFVIDFYDVLRFPDHRLHFLDVWSGNYMAFHTSQVMGFASGVIYYLLHQDRFYLFHTVFSFLVAGFALLGAIRIAMQKKCFLWILMLANFYFIFLPGPIGYGRYRFPVDIFWFVQANIGFIWLVEMAKSIILKNKQSDNIGVMKKS